jgi:hypothetical protein
MTVGRFRIAAPESFLHEDLIQPALACSAIRCGKPPSWMAAQRALMSGGGFS